MTARSTSQSRPLEGMGDRTITISALSKTYSVTGWRVGWAIAPPEVTSAIRKVHDFLTVGAAAPLAGSRRRRAALSAGVLRQACERIFSASRTLAGNSHRSRLSLLQTARRVLHHDRYFRVRFSRRCGLRQISRERNRRRLRPRLQLLPRLQPTAVPSSASHFAKKNPPSKPPPNASRSSKSQSELALPSREDIESAVGATQVSPARKGWDIKSARSAFLLALSEANVRAVSPARAFDFFDRQTSDSREPPAYIAPKSNDCL